MIKLSVEREWTPYSQEELRHFLENKVEFLLKPLSSDLRFLIEGLKLIDDVVLFYRDDYGYTYRNPSTGREADVYKEFGSRRTKKYAVRVKDWSSKGVLGKTNILIESGQTSLVTAKKIALDWVIYGRVPEDIQEKFSLVFRHAEV